MVLAPAVVLVLGAAGRAAEPVEDEYAVKAAITFNLLKFLEWPAGSPMAGQSEITVCVLDSPRMSAALRALTNRSIAGKRLVVSTQLVPSERGGCAAIFLGVRALRDVAVVAPWARANAAVTLADTPGAAEQGVMVNYAIEDGRVHFEINLAVLRAAGLHLSSGVLSMATIVGPREGAR